MAFDYVSEVDRNFFSNNLLTNEDLDMEGLDLADLLNCDVTLTSDNLVSDIPVDVPVPLDMDSSPVFEGNFHDELLQEYSDSSDSGISSVQYSNTPSPDSIVKQEPLSPTSSLSSDGIDLTLSQHNIDIIDIGDLKTESPPLSPAQLSTNQQVHMLPQQQSPITLIGQHTENVSPIVIGPNGIVQCINPSVNINSILNSKVKIQPKPISNTKVKPAAPKPADSGKSLVLTPEEFTRLTSQGVLKFEPPHQTQQTKTELPKIPVITKPQVKPSPIIQVDSEIKSIKRQQRMIKNRESASLSRKRKKEYMSTIEDQLKEFTLQNQKLHEENVLLKQRLNLLQNENNELKKSVTLPPAAKKICLLTVLLFFTLNLGSFSDILFPAYTPNRPHDRLVHKGRQLMSVEDNKDYVIGNFLAKDHQNSLRKFIQESMHNPQGIDNKTLFDFYTCTTHFNKTESLRLADQLAGWMQRHEQQKQKKKQTKPARPNKPLSHIQGELRSDIKSLRLERQRLRDTRYQMQLFQSDTVKDFWKTLPRRNDTFYVLSFNTDYFLVPATAHNKTMRPRMSLVMPATTLNETMQPPAGNIGMMQIDCEVLNTQLIHVHKSALPKNFGTRNSSHSSNDDDNFFP